MADNQLVTHKLPYTNHMLLYAIIIRYQQIEEPKILSMIYPSSK